MADITADGFTRVLWVLAIANQAAPTVAELNAGTVLHDTMASDGLNGYIPDTAAVPTSKFSSRFDTSQPGRVSYSGQMLRFFKQTSPDTIYTLLAYGSVGFLAVRRGQLAGNANASAQPFEIYPSVTGERRLLDPEPNTMQRWEAPFFFSAQPTLTAVVA